MWGAAHCRRAHRPRRIFLAIRCRRFGAEPALCVGPHGRTRRPLCDEWPLATFPAADDQPKQLRLLIFTCAGGHDGLGKHLPVSTRVRLLRRGLSFRPDAIIANGDHVYWDLRTRRGNQSGSSAEAA
jgi:hypothetical protein